MLKSGLESSGVLSVERNVDVDKITIEGTEGNMAANTYFIVDLRHRYAINFFK